MASQSDKATTFKNLHVPGDPVILYNVWDPGSAQAVAGLGAQAIALGSHGVANSYGYEDGEHIPLEVAIENAQRVVDIAGDLPVQMDIETGYGADAEAVYRSLERILPAGIAGINLEDTDLSTGELRSIDEQKLRIQAARASSQDADVPLFINARTDLFRNTDPSSHNHELLDKALERAQAFKDAGADGFFLPLITDLELIRLLCENSPLPVNIIAIPGTPSTRELASAGVARISYGPVPYLQMIEWFTAQAKAALDAK